MGYRPAVTRIPPRSPDAARALAAVEALQQRFVAALSAVSAPEPSPFVAVQWLRDGGRHGGGERLEAGDTAIFDRASVNVSQVHYDDEPQKRLSSATALSTIVHPRHPLAPSVHIHVSWTKLRNGPGYWRAMADLNPAIVHDDDREAFAAALRAAAPDDYRKAEAEGDRYFFIPALDRHRGAYHFYLEGLATEDPAADERLALAVGRAAIDSYSALLPGALAREPATEQQRAEQLAYHTLYLFQVLTLDRGTTSGLLIHRDNDVGILGSLPSRIDRRRLASFGERVPDLQRPLVEALVAALPEGDVSPVDADTKQRLADVVREHYRAYPQALRLQASGSVVPPTVANHANHASHANHGAGRGPESR